MTTAPTAGAGAAPAHDGYRHDALVYAGLAGFLAATVPFLREGVQAGQPVMAAVAPPRLEALRDALGEDARAVQLVDMTGLGRNPARILPAWLDFVDQAGGRPVRGIGEPVWAGRSAAEVAECQLHEALLNVAVSPDTPLWLRCPYDRTALDPSVLREAHRSHPVVVDESGYSGSTTYGGLTHVVTLYSAGLAEPPDGAEQLLFGRADLDAVRIGVRVAGRAAGLSQDRVDDLTVAVFELATNSVQHGGGTGRLRWWSDPSALVFELQDDGHIADPLTGRRTPPLESTGGRGVWLANQLVDLVQLRSAPGGTTVRLTTWR